MQDSNCFWLEDKVENASAGLQIWSEADTD